MSKFVGTGPSSYEKRIYQAAVSQRLRNTGLEHLENSLILHHFASPHFLMLCLYVTYWLKIR